VGGDPKLLDVVKNPWGFMDGDSGHRKEFGEVWARTTSGTR